MVEQNEIYPGGSTSYLVTDVEANGLTPGVNSLLSIASVAVDGRGEEQDRFVINLEPVRGTAPDPATMQWWETQPDAWVEATQDPSIRRQLFGCL